MHSLMFWNIEWPLEMLAFLQCYFVYIYIILSFCLFLFQEKCSYYFAGLAVSFLFTKIVRL